MSPGHPWSTLYVDGGLKFFPEWDPQYMEALHYYIHKYRGIRNCFWWSWNADAGELLKLQGKALLLAWYKFGNQTNANRGK